MRRRDEGHRGADLQTRLCEGTGAVSSLPLVQAVARVLRDMGTFPEQLWRRTRPGRRSEAAFRVTVMSTWSWTFEDASGKRVTPPSAPSAPFPSQADAEGWIGESYQQLVSEGVDAVRLHEDDTEVYGPMSLHPTG